MDMNTQRVKTGAELVEFIKNEQVMRNTFACDVTVNADGKSMVKKVAFDGIGLVVENESVDPDQFVSTNSVFVAAVLD
jgi:hypothetical protein